MKRDQTYIEYVCEYDETPMTEHEMDQLADILAEWIYRWHITKDKSEHVNTDPNNDDRKSE